jgi:predicted phage baseplate assembly protein
MLELPNLDDRRWADLVEDARALIPLYAPEWTDHNVHDPGITVIELLASIAELDIYQLNQISDRHRRKFLELVGVEPRPPRSARGAVAFRLSTGVAKRSIPAGTELVESEDPTQPVRARTLTSFDVLPFELEAVLIGSDSHFVDVSVQYTGRGVAPAPPPPIFRAGGGASQALYLGFQVTGVPEVGAQLSLYLAFEGVDADLDARSRLLDEGRRAIEACRDPQGHCRPCGTTAEEADGDDAVPPPTPEVPLRHHSAVTTWEYWHGDNARWEAVVAVDDTRSFTLDGTVVITIPDGWTARTLDGIAEPLLYLRGRLVSGELDVPPVLRAVGVNSVEVEQAHPVSQTWKIAPSVTIGGTPPTLGALTGLRLHFGDDGRIDALAFVDEEPRLAILELEKKPGIEGRLTIEAVVAGRASGTPNLRLTLADRPVVASTFRLLSLEGDRWRVWQRRTDFFSSRRSDAHDVLDASRGVVDFGDGEHGRVVPDRARVFATYGVTLAELGNLPAGASFTLDDSPRNRALLTDVPAARQQIAAAVSPVPIVGGQAMETLAHAIGRAIDDREASHRAVTLADYETLALHTPGTRVARASARANVRPGLGCVSAGGHVSVLIVPDSGAARPSPTVGLRNAVSRYLSRRRIIGARVEVLGPDYVEVAVRATVAAFPRLNKAEVRARAVAALNTFFDPIRGGPDGTGWPFGRDVYRSEVLETLDRTEGVDRVESLALVVEDCDGQCGNVCLPSNGLVAAGRHQIEVV